MGLLKHLENLFFPCARKLDALMEKNAELCRHAHEVAKAKRDTMSKNTGQGSHHGFNGT